MRFGSMEDRLNPVPPEDADESTVGGYMAIHGRSAAWEGSDGMPYTAAIEAEESDDGWVGYLVFLRWAADSTAIMGHIDSDDLASGGTEEAARRGVEELSLADAKLILDRLIAQRKEWAEG